MKTIILFLSAIVLILFASCKSSFYYQVYKTSSTDKIDLKENMVVYEDDNCKVSYNFWSEGGNIGFKCYNKTDKNLYLNMEESFFILNGISYNYFKNRVFTHSTNSGTSTSHGTAFAKSVSGIDYTDSYKMFATNNIGIMTTTGYSVAYNEEKIINIPPKTSKIITEYNINETLFRDCDLFKYPSKKQIKSKTYTKAESPFVFSNRLAYSIGQSDNLIRFENEFYVTEISNYPKSEMFETKTDEYCGQKEITTTQYFKNASPDKFYISYTKGQDTWAH
jgi:hypothetical protein